VVRGVILYIYICIYIYIYLCICIGTNDVVRGVSHTFTRIRHEISLSEVFIKVEVYANDYNDNNEYVSNINANGHVLSTYCSPQVDQGGFFYTCIRDRNVTSFIDYTKDDGTLTVTVQATRSVDAYPYLGFLLYVKMSISGLIRFDFILYLSCLVCMKIL
jgi:hypothetical protein